MFQRSRHDCYLVDYNQQPVKFVNKIGDTVDDVGKANKFHLIVCNHVIEHVANPVETIRQLSEHLDIGGVIYVDVPQEIWRKAPLHDEPVTHVNFFVAESLRRTLQEAGLNVRMARNCSYLHPTGAVLPAVRAVGQAGSYRGERKVTGYPRVMRLLAPTFAERVRRVWALRAKLPEMVKYRLGLAE